MGEFGLRRAGRTSGRPGRSRSGRTGSCSWPTTPRPRCSPSTSPTRAPRPEPSRSTWRTSTPGRLVPRLRAGDVVIRDMAVHPVSHNVYLSVQRGHGEAAQPVLVRIGRLDGSVAEVPLDDVPSPRPDRRCPRRRRRAAGRHAPLGDEGEELQVGERQDPHPAAADPHLDGHRHGLRRRRAARRRAVERGVLLQAAAHPVPVQRRGRPATAWRSSTSPTASGRRRRRSARSSPTTAARASWPATPARRWCISPWPTSRPAPRPWAGRWPSSGR